MDAADHPAGHCQRILRRKGAARHEHPHGPQALAVGSRSVPLAHLPHLRPPRSAAAHLAARGSRNNGTKTHAKPRPRSVSWWLLALKEQSPGGSVRDLSLSRDGPNRHIGVLRAELSHLPPRSIVQTRTPNVLPLDSCSRHSGFHTVRGGLVVVEEVYRHPAMVSNSRPLPLSVRFRSIVPQPPASPDGGVSGLAAQLG